MKPCDLSAVEARALIGAKQLSPVELLESCIEQLEYANPHVNAVVTKAYERAKAEAVAAERAVQAGEELGCLHGLPVVVKDLNETEGILTTHGSLLFRDHVPDKDEHVVAALRGAGAIVLGKTNTPEFGAGGNTSNRLFGPTRNPFDLALTCGGSSGGSGVALATNMAPLATGSDTGGSLRIPAAFCGVVAYRPTPGVVPFDHRSQAYSTYQAQGPMARTVRDCALMLAAMSERLSTDPMSFPMDPRQFLSLPDVDVSRLRVAVSADLGITPLDNDIRLTFESRIARWSGVFASVEEMKPSFDGILDTFWHLRGIYMLARHGRTKEDYGDQVNPNVLSNINAALGMKPEQFGWAAERQHILMQDFARGMEPYDILICPCVAVPPFPVDQLFPKTINGVEMENYVHWAALTSSLTVTGNPVVAMPCGTDARGLPFGLQIVGKLYQDRFVLAAAAAIEKMFASEAASSRPAPGLARGEI